MGTPKTKTVTTTQKQELDPIAQGYLWSGQLPMEKMESMRRINEQVYGYAPGTLTPVPTAASPSGLDHDPYRMSGEEERRQEERIQSHIDDVNSRNGRDSSGGLGDAFSSATGGYTSVGDMFDGGGPGQSGDTFQGGGRASDIANAVTGKGPEAQANQMANGGIVALAGGGMVPPMMGGRMPNLSNQDMAYQMAMQAMRPRPAPYAMGGYVEGPGTGTSDDIPAKIYQDGQPVQEAALSDGEFVMTERAVRGAGNGDPRAGAARMYEMMRKFERGGRVS